MRKSGTRCKLLAGSVMYSAMVPCKRSSYLSTTLVSKGSTSDQYQPGPHILADDAQHSTAWRVVSLKDGVWMDCCVATGAVYLPYHPSTLELGFCGACFDDSNKLMSKDVLIAWDSRRTVFSRGITCYRILIVEDINTLNGARLREPASIPGT